MESTTKTTDSIPYYTHHARRLAEQDLRFKNPGELIPFIELLAPGSKILDLGAGTGVDSHYFMKAGFQVTAIEGSGDRVALAKAQYPDLQIEAKNFLFLNLGESTLDGVWANASLHHFSPELVQRIVAVIFRGLKSKGIFGAVVYEGETSFLDRDGDLTGPSRMIHPYSERAICSMFEQTGFRILKIGRMPASFDHGHPLPRMLILSEKI